MHHFNHKPMPELEKLWVIAVVSNPARYRSRYELFQKFNEAMRCTGHKVNLLIVEAALGERPFELDHYDNIHHLTVRTWDEIWLKENMINLGIQRLPSDWKYVAWIDADVMFTRHDWPTEIVHQLQHYEIIQCFQQAIDMGPKGEVHKVHDGFVYAWMNGKLPATLKYNHGAHPGYGWAAHRSALDDLGTLFDVGILGSSDHHMAWALVGQALERAPADLTAGYKRHLKMWQDRATTHIRQDIGFMPGVITHAWHGRKADRRYQDRWKILLKHNYDPTWDLQRDTQGLYRLSDVGARMRNDLRAYFHGRNEDSIDL